MRVHRIAVSAALLVLTAAARPQTPASAPTANPPSQQPPASAPEPPAPPAPNSSAPGGSYLYHWGIFEGAGVSTSAATGSKPVIDPTGDWGAGLTLAPLPVFFEFGVMSPQANRSYVSGYFSLDGSVPLAPPGTKYRPMAIAGYSRLYETGHALDYGLARALPRLGKPRDDSRSLRMELRDYCTFANPTQHNAMQRIGWMRPETD